ncbi:MAG: hypothetical protein QOG89_2703 [Thermomicrobiales bacterium]|nr:hypothetical protein [Thermomicrobiales bacterium]
MMTLTRPRMLSSIDARDAHRIVAVVSGLTLSVVGIGLYAGASWATTLWPWPDVRMTYVFLASVLAAAIAPSLWIGINGELAVLAPGALNTLLLNLMFAAYLGARGLRSDEPKLLVAAAINLAVVPLFVSLLRRSRAIPVKDTRPMPRVVTVALWTACAMLIVVGVPLLMQVENVFPWTLTPQTSTIFGCIFLGAAGYFAYAARQPYWVFGKVPILGFLAYDLVLFSPYIDLLRRPSAGISSSYGSYGGRRQRRQRAEPCGVPCRDRCQRPLRDLLPLRQSEDPSAASRPLRIPPLHPLPEPSVVARGCNSRVGVGEGLHRTGP